MSEQLRKQLEIQRFNDAAQQWAENIPQVAYEAANKLAQRLAISKEACVLDVACGTGILFPLLQNRNNSNYIGIDIADKMVYKFLKTFPNADVRCMDFEQEIKLAKTFDCVIIYNSIPHFNDLDKVFQNVHSNLKENGKFVIAHSRTRNGLSEHHKRIGYISDKKEPIPGDLTLIELSRKYGFKDVEIEDMDYFFFACNRI